MLRSTITLIKDLNDTVAAQREEIETLKRKHLHMSTALFDARCSIRHLKEALNEDRKPNIRRVA